MLMRGNPRGFGNRSGFPSKIPHILPLLTVLTALTLCMPASALAGGGRETLVETHQHNLPVGCYATSWEHRIALPDDWAMNEVYFNQRRLVIKGKLHVEREELSATGYMVRVGLPATFKGPASGSVTIELGASAGWPEQPVLPPPSGVEIGGKPATPRFSWNGAGLYTAITLYDREWNQTVWERVILGATEAVKVDGQMLLGHRYLWGMKQADETGRYSSEVQGSFKIVKRNETCQPCHGTGKQECPVCHGTGTVEATDEHGQPITKTCARCKGTGSEACPSCNGSGSVQVTAIINEPVPVPFPHDATP